MKISYEVTMKQSIEIYQSGEIEIEVSVDAETIWLSPNDMAAIFGVQRPAVVKHIGNIYKSNELAKDVTCSILEQLTKDGNVRKVNYYSLDMVISVGYRENSLQATRFRQWATKVLKNYISNGYAINASKITHARFVSLEQEVQSLNHRVSNIDTRLHDNTLSPTQGIFYDGHVFDAYVCVAKLIKSAKHSIVLIDNYIDESVLTLFSKNKDVQVKSGESLGLMGKLV